MISFNKVKNSYGYNNFITTDELLNCNKPFIFNDKAVIGVYICIYKKKCNA